MNVPDPGTAEAFAQGCICDQPNPQNTEGWWVSRHCPLHGRGTAWAESLTLAEEEDDA